MYSNEVLEKGLSELEALHLKIQARKVADKYEGRNIRVTNFGEFPACMTSLMESIIIYRTAQQKVCILSGQNQYLAHTINTALQGSI